MHLIVGSSALEHYGMSRRPAKDFDIFHDNEVKFPKNIGDKKIETHIIPTEILSLIPKEYNFATPDAIYTIKCSHASWDINWQKTINDIIYLRDMGCELIPELYWALYNYWKTIHGDKKHLSLDKTKEEFFDDYVEHIIEHDFLHVIVARPNAPMYESVLKTGAEVLTSKEYFDKLSYEQQLKLFREEICVIALERWIIPSKFKIGAVEAYGRALKKTITNLTKNWATLFILENIQELRRMRNKDWFNNYKLEIGESIMTTDAIAKLQAKAEELMMDDSDVEEILLDEYGAVENLPDDDFGNMLREMQFKHIIHEGGEGEGDYAMDVIQLEGQLYKLEYSYASYDGYYIDDIWGWQPVQAVKKEVTVYE